MNNSCTNFLTQTSTGNVSGKYGFIDIITKIYPLEPMLDTSPPVSRAQKRQVALAGPMRLTTEGSKGAWPGDNSNQCAQGYNCPVSNVISCINATRGLIQL
jgi:hypothetical protein